jgi:hypothetical protein
LRLGHAPAGAPVGGAEPRASATPPRRGPPIPEARAPEARAPEARAPEARAPGLERPARTVPAARAAEGLGKTGECLARLAAGPARCLGRTVMPPGQPALRPARVARRPCCARPGRPSRPPAGAGRPVT